MTALTLATSIVDRAIALTPFLFVCFVIARELVKAAPAAPTPPPAAPMPEPAPTMISAQAKSPTPQDLKPATPPAPQTLKAMRARALALGMRGASRATRAQLLAFLG